MILEKTQAELANHVLFPVPSKELGKGVLVSQTYWGNLLVGPTSRDPSTPRTNEEILKDLIGAATALVQDLDVGRVITSYAGYRAKSSRGDFIVEESSRVPRFLNVAGIDSPGLTSSPAVALRVLSLVQHIFRRDYPHSEASRRNHHFQPYRKPIVDQRSKRRMVVGGGSHDGGGGPYAIDHPDPARNIICRCERITESEIVDALRRPLAQATIPSVKRRTRAGMGTCQGRFCEPRVAEVVARWNHMREEDVGGLEPGSSLLPHRRLTEQDRNYLDQLAQEVRSERADKEKDMNKNSKKNMSKI